MTTPNGSVTIIDQSAGLKHAFQNIGGSPNKYVPVCIPSDQNGNMMDPVPSNVASSSLSNLSYSSSSQQALAANTARRWACFFNDATVAVYVKFGTTASASSFTVKIRAGGYFEMEIPMYTGQIDAIWDGGGSGALRVTELS